MNYRTKLVLLSNTVRYLKPIQVRYRLKYFIRSRFRKVNSIILPASPSKDSNKVAQFQQSIYNASSYKSGQSFSFLNIEHTFTGKIDWNLPDHGRLWTYNLNYFEFLNQENITKEEGLRLVDAFLETIEDNTTGLEPYPISLRVMNWIRFFITRNTDSSKYDNSLWAQLQLLRKLKEYHLLGNHLLENGFALLFGAYYFNDASLYKEAKSILLPELDEQVLEDGAHFELSPMYHCLMTYRVLDCYNLVTSSNLFNKELLSLIKGKAEKMIAFLNGITYRNGDIPLMNDAANGIAPRPGDLFEYAECLGLEVEFTKPASSGYRKFTSDTFELLFDVGELGPTYQPGHAHADTLGFELHVNGKPVLVDSGTSTYEVNETRFHERSTSAHNTVTLDGENSSQVWAGHRVGKRAKVELLLDDTKHVKVRHDGYMKKFGVHHTREIQVVEKCVTIIDDLGDKEGVAHFHFAPGVEIQTGNNQVTSEGFRIIFANHQSIEEASSFYSPEFNKRIENVKLKVTFTGTLITQILCE